MVNFSNQGYDMFTKLQKINNTDIIINTNTIVAIESGSMGSETSIIKTVDGSVIYVKHSFEDMENMLMRTADGMYF